MSQQIKGKHVFTTQVNFRGATTFAGAASFSDDVTIAGVLTASGGTTLAGLWNAAAADLPLQTGVTATTQAVVKHVSGAIVNVIALKGAIATAEPEIAAEGTDTDIDVKLTPKGAGTVNAGAAPVLCGRIKLAAVTVATAISAVTAGAGAVIYVSDGNAGTPCLAVSDGTNWKVVAMGATISAS